MTPTESARLLRTMEVLDQLLEAIGQRSVITAIQHYGQAGEKERLMRVRREAAALLGKQHLHR